MDQRGKGLTVLLILLVAVLLVVSGAGLYLFQKERNNSMVLQEELTDIKSRLLTTERKLDESKKTITDLQAKLDDAKTEIGTISSQLDQERSARQEAATKLDQFKADLETQKGLRVSLESKFNQAQDEARKAQSQINELQSQKIDLEKKMGELEQRTSGVELGKIVVSPEQQKAVANKDVVSKPSATVKAPAGLEGKVLVVNKEYNFAVINIGSKDGVAIGSEFSVFNSDKLLGDIKVEKVRDSMAAAGFVSADLKDKINEGDKVVKKGK